MQRLGPVPVAHSWYITLKMCVITLLLYNTEMCDIAVLLNVLYAMLYAMLYDML